MEMVDKVVEAIRSRNTELTIEGDKIIASRPLLPDEREFLKANRADVITYLHTTPAPGPETPEAAYRRGWIDGIRQATEELQAKMLSERPPPMPTNPEKEIARLVTWQRERPTLYWWEPENLEALKTALRPGDQIAPMFAFSCLIIHADGSESEFRRVRVSKA